MEWFFSLPVVLQALIAGCVTWMLTGCGAFLVFPLKGLNQKLLDGALGMAGGIMVAASFYSLLNPAFDHALELGINPLLPLITGFLAGGGILLLADRYLPIGGTPKAGSASRSNRLMFGAVTLHNIPEGLAIGVAIGAAATPEALVAALVLALGIGIQNLPEGAAIALPLRRDGFSRRRAFFYGQLSAIVEPLAAVAGALLTVAMGKALPFALTFAAGAMLYVVFAEINPEAHASGNKRIVAALTIIGFAIMMFLDVLLS